MRYWDAVFAFLVAASIAGVLTPVAGLIARRIGAVAPVRDRGMNAVPIPELGGLAILAGVLVAAVIWMPSTIMLPRVPHGRLGSGGTIHTWLLLCGAGVITLVGALDDAIELPPVVKLLGQIAAAVIAVLAGAVVRDLTVPFFHSVQFRHAGGPLTVLWLVALMNVVNFSDGIDGLCGGLCTIDGIVFAVIAFDLQGGKSAAAVLAAITAGASLGFLVHNFPPASIFMGDTGANLLGYLLGVIAVAGSLKTNAFVAVAAPLCILAVPLLDTGFVVAKRLKYGRKPWEADRSHFHHRMSNIGFSPRKTVLYLYAWTLVLAGLALALRFVPFSDHHGHYRAGWVAVIGVIVLIAIATSVYVVYVLEILKFKTLRTRQMRDADPETSEHEIRVTVRRDIETGEFERVGRRD